MVEAIILTYIISTSIVVFVSYSTKLWRCIIVTNLDIFGRTVCIFGNFYSFDCEVYRSTTFCCRKRYVNIKVLLSCYIINCSRTVIILYNNLLIVCLIFTCISSLRIVITILLYGTIYYLNLVITIILIECN